MKRILPFTFCIFASLLLAAQKLETVYLNATDTTADKYLAVLPEGKSVKGLLFLLDGFGVSPQGVLQETSLPVYAAAQGLVTILPLLKTGPLYFGDDSASQASLHQHIQHAVTRYSLTGKPFFIGGFSIGGSCALKYAEQAAADKAWLKPTAVFGVDPPLDWEKFYNGAKRVVRLAAGKAVNSEVTYMIGRIEKEMGGTPQTAIQKFYAVSPYSFSDTTQRAVKLLKDTPLMLITEPDMQWWLENRNYDVAYTNFSDHVCLINELRLLGNQAAVLITTTNKGYRQPGGVRHPHSWSIAEPKPLVDWLFTQAAEKARLPKSQ